ncbi:hypothetical protein Ancab_039595 [Ancistrocladus abbreviatus]
MDPSIIWSAAKWISTQLINEGNFLLGVQDQVYDLERELKYIALHLRVADSGEEVGDEELRLFTVKIREVAFRAEDVVDNYIIQVASASSSNTAANANGGNCLRKFLCFLRSSPDIHSIGKETEVIRKSIQKEVDLLKDFRNTRFIAQGEGSDKPWPHPKVMQTYPHTPDAYVVGREKDVEELVQRLTNKMEARFMAIVGAGGLGKTTLARMIYNDNRIKDHFKPTAWVRVSQQWDPKDLLSEILRQTKGISPEERISIRNWSEPEFVEAINCFLSEKPYLIVLDDVWARKAWLSIYAALAHTGSGSKVIITSRRGLYFPLPVDDRCFTHRPRFLNEEQSLELFYKIALEGRDPQSTVDDDAIQLGREMIARCDGLPLGVVTLAGLLRTKDASEWEEASRSFNSIILNVQGPPQYGRSLYQNLTLSYYDLPHYLKPCFLYFALFPEDAEISAKMLTRMWIAEGFVATHDELVQRNESVEDVAQCYLDELIQRCVVQVVAKSFTTGKAKKCRLHDLTHNFCIAKAEEQCFLRVFSSTNQSNISTLSSTQLRRVSILESEVSLPTQCSHTRSLIQFGEKELNLKARCKDLKMLRILILHGAKIDDGYLPEELGNLKLLRHLALINTNIKNLPESIGNLSNLLYLEYTVKDTLAKGVTLPNVLWRMKLLRHLYLDEKFTFSEGLRLHTLINLQTLWAIRLSPSQRADSEMDRLSSSLRKLGILQLQRQGLLDDLFQSPCMTSGNLVNLKLQWISGVKLKSMEPLHKYCHRLKKLTLLGRVGEDSQLQFPPSLVKLALRNSELNLYDPMVAAGRLDYLKFLCLGNGAYRGTKMICNSHAFRHLEELHLLDLDDLEEWWLEEGAMPQLKKLLLFRCRRLERLPQGLKSIRTLQQLKIWFMRTTFCYRLFRQGQAIDYEFEAGAADEGEKGEDFHIIQHISHVHFKYVGKQSF